MAMAIKPKISSAGCGMIGALVPQPPSSAATTSVDRCTVSPGGGGCRSAEDEREGQTEDGQRLGEGEAQERDRLQHAASLGLTRDAVDVGGEDQTDADTGADGGEAVAEDGDVSGHGPHLSL